MTLRIRMNTALAVAALAAVAFTGCRRENGIDNNNVIRTPYSLYLVDREGVVLATNNGEQFRTVFSADGFTPRSFLTTGANILMVKVRTFLSEDDGLNFNPTDSSAAPDATHQSMMVEVPSHNRIYLASTKGNGDIYSENKGKTWAVDTLWDTSITNYYIPRVHTFSQLRSGDFFAWNNRDSALYKRTGPAVKWLPVAYNGLPAGRSNYFLSHFMNTLLLTDSLGANGVRYSNDNGQNWSAYAGLPKVKLFATEAPLDGGVLVGTDSNGVYRLVGGGFIPSNGGLDINTSVYSIAAKTNTFKNEENRRYIYIATSTGLYRSEDAGANWVKMIDGNFTKVY